MWHYVCAQTGEVCLDILKTTWSPAWTLHSVCQAIMALLSDPAADSPLNCDAGGWCALRHRGPAGLTPLAGEANAAREIYLCTHKMSAHVWVSAHVPPLARV